MIKKAVMLVSVLVLSIGIAFATSNPNVETAETATYNTYASLTGVVIDANSGAIIPNATVTLNETSATTDENGAFTFEEVEAGSHTITVEAEGYETAEQALEVTEEGANVEIALQPSME